MTNETPPIACLADFKSTTVIPNPDHPEPDVRTYAETNTPSLGLFYPMGTYRNIEGCWVPTKAGDIYAFGMTIFQVFGQYCGYRSFHFYPIYIQILAGYGPSRKFWPPYPSRPPAKPDNASEIGLSDLLWDFLQLCWDPDGKRRPVVEEVVTCLAEAASNWKPKEPSNESPGRSREEHIAPVATSESRGLSLVGGTGKLYGCRGGVEH